MSEEIIPFNSFFLSFKNSLRNQDDTLNKLTNPYTLMFLLYGDYRNGSGLAESIHDYPSENLTNIRKKPNGASFPIDGYLVYYNLFKRPFSPNTENTSEDVRYKELDRYCKKDFAGSSSEKAIKTYLHNQAKAGQPLITPKVDFFNKFLESLTSLLQAPLYPEDNECKSLWNKMVFYGARYKSAFKTNKISNDVYPFINSEEAKKYAPYFISKFIAQTNDNQNDAEAEELIKYLNMCADEEYCFKKINDKSFKDNYSELCKKNWLYCARFFFISVLNYARKCQNIRKDKYAKNQVNAKSTSKQCEQPMLKPDILVPNPPEGMIGRDSYVERIKVLFSEKKEELTGSVVYLLGERGIGKTCIAEKFISQYKKEYQQIVYIDTGDSFVKAVCTCVKFDFGIPAFMTPEKSQKQYFYEIVAGLKQICPDERHKILFWIDNLDNVFLDGPYGEEEAYEVFTSLPFDFLVCTYNNRMLPSHDVESVIKVEELNENDLFSLYKTEYGPTILDSESENKFIRETIDYVGSNTLAVAAIAAEAGALDILPSEMYRRITEDGIPGEGHQLEIENSYIKSRGITPGDLFRKMYNIADIKDMAYAEEILFDIGLMSPCSIDINTFIDACGIQEKDAVKATIKRLQKRNWISSLYYGETKSEKIYVHQLKADVYLSIAKEQCCEYVLQNHMLDKLCNTVKIEDLYREYKTELLLNEVKPHILAQKTVSERREELKKYIRQQIEHSDVNHELIREFLFHFIFAKWDSFDPADLFSKPKEWHTKDFLFIRSIILNLQRYKYKCLSTCRFFAEYNRICSDSWHDNATYIADYCDMKIESGSYEITEIERLLLNFFSVHEEIEFERNLSYTVSSFNRLLKIYIFLEEAIGKPVDMKLEDIPPEKMETTLRLVRLGHIDKFLKKIKARIEWEILKTCAAYDVPFDTFCEINGCRLPYDNSVSVDKWKQVNVEFLKLHADWRNFFYKLHIDENPILPSSANDDLNKYRLITYGKGAMVIKLPKE